MKSLYRAGGGVPLCVCGVTSGRESHVLSRLPAPTILETLVALVALLLAAPAGVAQQGPSGAISGIVQTDDGRPLKDAMVFIAFRPSRVGEPAVPYSATISTDVNGQFKASAVPDGKYAVCVGYPRGKWIDTCSWGPEPTTLVVNGQAVTFPLVRLKPGADLHVHIDDPGGKLSAEEGIEPGAGLMVVAKLPTGFSLPIPKTAIDRSGADHHLTVPTDTDLVLVAYSPTYIIQDGNGKPADRSTGYVQTIRIPAGAQQHTETIRVR